MKIEKSTFITKIKTKMILFVPENALIKHDSFVLSIL
jgi:hypothetical protein